MFAGQHGATVCLKNTFLLLKRVIKMVNVQLKLHECVSDEIGTDWVCSSYHCGEALGLVKSPKCQCHFRTDIHSMPILYDRVCITFNLYLKRCKIILTQELKTNNDGVRLMLIELGRKKGKKITNFSKKYLQRRISFENWSIRSRAEELQNME